MQVRRHFGSVESIGAQRERTCWRRPRDQICGYCYQQAKRTRGTCACGHVEVLPGRGAGQPACRKCPGVTLNIDCVRCGAEDELYRNCAGPAR